MTNRLIALPLILNSMVIEFNILDIFTSIGVGLYINRAVNNDGLLLYIKQTG